MNKQKKINYYGRNVLFSILTNGLEIEVILLCKSLQQDEQLYFKYSFQTTCTQEAHTFLSWSRCIPIALILFLDNNIQVQFHFACHCTNLAKKDSSQQKTLKVKNSEL